MNWCVKCNQELRCDKNGVGLDFGQGHVYHTDRFKCHGCGFLLLKTERGQPFLHDPYYDFCDEYLKTPEALKTETELVEQVTETVQEYNKKIEKENADLKAQIETLRRKLK